MDHSDLTSLNSTRLVDLLSDVNDLSIRISQANFAEKFGQMLHFSSAITLSSALEDAPGAAVNPSNISEEKIRNAFFSMQTDLVRFIAEGFVTSARRGDDRLPTAKSLHAHCELTGVFSATYKSKTKKHAVVYEPFRKFYINRQNGLDIKVQHLRSEIREAISGLSPSLAQLARIDQALSESLSDAAAELFAVIPKLLEKRFFHLWDAHRPEFPENPEVGDFEQWMKPGGWISVFCNEMRELLFAELEVRLQPVVGMIDSLPATITPNRTTTD